MKTVGFAAGWLFPYVLSFAATDAALIDAFRGTQRQAERVGSGYRLRNPENRFDAEFQDGAVTLTHSAGRFALRVMTDEPATIQATAGRVEYRRRNFTEWYSNEARGLEQGFTFNERPRQLHA